MSTLNGQNLNTLLVGGGFIAIVLTIGYIRNWEANRLKRLTGDNEILISAFNVYYHGRESEPGKPLRSVGALALTRAGLLYRSRLLRREFFVPGDKISSITVINEFKGKNMYEFIVAINFETEEGGSDRAGFKIPHPERWSQAIRTAFPHVT